MMEEELRRVSDKLRLPEGSRERIRSYLSEQPTNDKKEETSVKRPRIRTKVALIAAVVVLALAMTVTAGAAVTGLLFHNDIIVDSADDLPSLDGTGGGAPAFGYSVVSSSGMEPFSLEEMIESSRAKSDDWDRGERLNGGPMYKYAQWDTVEVLSDDPALRSRKVSRGDGAVKMEYTAENPADLLAAMTGNITLDLSWMDEHYGYVPDGNFLYQVSDPWGRYISESLLALYAKEDGSAYVRVDVDHVGADGFYENADAYIIDGSYETAYYYTSADGLQFVVKMDHGNVWASCYTDHASISLYGGYLTRDEVEDILDNLHVDIAEQ